MQKNKCLKSHDKHSFNWKAIWCSVGTSVSSTLSLSKITVRVMDPVFDVDPCLWVTHLQSMTKVELGQLFSCWCYSLRKVRDEKPWSQKKIQVGPQLGPLLPHYFMCIFHCYIIAALSFLKLLNWRFWEKIVVGVTSIPIVGVSDLPY